MKDIIYTEKRCAASTGINRSHHKQSRISSRAEPAETILTAALIRSASSKVAAVLLAIFALGLLTGCDSQSDWLTFRGFQGSGYTPDQIFPPLGVRWKLKLQEKRDQASSFNPPLIQGNDIYFGSADGNFYSLDIESGFMNWIYKTRASVNSVPFADEQRVYFGSNDGSVYALDRKTGKEIWSFPTGNTVRSLVLKWEDTIIFTSDTGSTFFLDENGKEINRIPNPVWSHHTFQVYDGVVYWAPMGRNFGAYDIRNRRFLWTINVNVPYYVWYSFPAIDETSVYYASNYLTRNGPILRYYASDRMTGELLWQYEADFNPGPNTPFNRDTIFMNHIDRLDYMAPALWGDYVIYTSGDSVVRAINRRTGEIAWEKNFDYPTSSAPTVAGNRIYFGLSGSEHSGLPGGGGVAPKLVCISATNGDLLWDTDLEGAVLSAPVIAGKRIFFGTEEHQFYVLEAIF